MIFTVFSIFFFFSNEWFNILNIWQARPTPSCFSVQVETFSLIGEVRVVPMLKDITKSKKDLETKRKFINNIKK